MVRIEHGDMLQVIPRLVAEGVVVDAIVTDPPYHLKPTLERFKKTRIGGDTDAERRATARSDPAARLSGGFMGQQWDGGDVAFRPETWATVASIMRPGGFLVVFGGTRTHHRVWCAIEDAGFVIQDSILNLISTDTRVSRFLSTLTADQTEAFSAILDQMQPTGDFAWCFGSGFPKRGDALKPAHEPICLAYKPGGKRTMQIDECRIEGREQEQEQGKYDGSNVQVAGPRNGGKIYPMSLGRWPANVIHDGSDEVMAAFPESESSPSTKVPEPYRPNGKNQVYGVGMGGGYHPGFTDTGSAARFFYCAKADSEDRYSTRHPTVKPIDLISWLVKLVVPPKGLFLDPFAGSGTAAIAALRTRRDAILIEREEQYVKDIKERVETFRNYRRMPSRRDTTPPPTTVKKLF